MKTIPHKFHHLKRIHSNRKYSRSYKNFRKAKIYRIPDLEPLDYSNFKLEVPPFYKLNIKIISSDDSNPS